MGAETGEERIADIGEYVSALKNSRKFGPQVVCHRQFPAAAPEWEEQFPVLDPALIETLRNQGISSLYSHQGQAIRAVLEGENVIVATPTASGKSMIYNLPLLSNLLGGSDGHGIYLSPLKALAQDQYKTLTRLHGQLPQSDGGVASRRPLAALFDGDNSAYQRRKIKSDPPTLLLTNPEMVHLSMLPYHHSWAEFFSRLRYVIIDEVHSYRGVVGSNMAWVLRRLQRVVAHYAPEGAREPVFIMLSATIGNPRELAEALIDRPVRVVTRSGAAQAEKHILFLNPWDSAAHTACQLLEAAVKRGLRTIVYTQSRKMTELIHMWTSPRLGDKAGRLSAYRAGFLPEERREIEGKLFSGELLGVISTSALELGIDVGDLDLCILVGYPGSVMSTMQRGGRVGRGGRASATILIGQEDALDQHFMRCPDDFFQRKPESASLNPFNPSIMDQHLHCCSAELPLEYGGKLLENRLIEERVEVLSRAGVLLETATGGRWLSARKQPQRDVSLRGGGRQLAIINGESGEVIGEIDNVRALKECHPGAVYLHRASNYLVTHLDLTGGEVVVVQKNPPYYTRPTSEKQTEILERLDVKQCFCCQVSFGRLRVRERVTGYQKKHNTTGKLISTFPLELPEMVIETEGLWLDLPPEVVEKAEKEKYHFMGGIHAMEHAMIALFPLLVLCDRNDIGGISCPLHEQTEAASIFIYDGYPGGIGLCREAYQQMDTLLRDTLRTVTACGCETGCPSCVHSPKCGSGNRPIDKQACCYLLEQVLKNAGGNRAELAANGGDSAGHAGPGENRDGLKPQPLSLFPGKDSAPKAARRRGLEALPENYCVFDLETMRSAEEVGGWNRAELMGVSVGVLYDGASGEFLNFVESEASQLAERLFSYDLVVGFNNKRFDNQVLSAYCRKDLHRLPSLDLLEEVHNQLGYRLSLNRLAETTLGTEKSADGLQALQWYKEGRLDLIRHYCKKDVEITRDVFLYALENGYLLFTNKAGHKVRLPLALEPRIDQLVGNMADRGM